MIKQHPQTQTTIRIAQAIVTIGVMGLHAVFQTQAQAQTAAIPEPTQEQIRQQQEQQSKDRARAIQEQQPIAPDVHLGIVNLTWLQDRRAVK